MHEASITDSLLSLAIDKAKEAKAKKITRINVIFGELSGVVGECVQFYFDVVSKNTLADGAVLNFTAKPTVIRCNKCHKEFHPENHDWICPDCHEMSIDIVSGRECYMESIEVE
jgi:hydrogenase nickel incorporation protein HypA/HybF